MEAAGAWDELAGTCSTGTVLAFAGGAGALVEVGAGAMGAATCVAPDTADGVEELAGGDAGAADPPGQKVMVMPALSSSQALWTQVSSGWKNAVGQFASEQTCSVPEHWGNSKATGTLNA